MSVYSSGKIDQFSDYRTYIVIKYFNLVKNEFCITEIDKKTHYTWKGMVIVNVERWNFKKVKDFYQGTLFYLTFSFSISIARKQICSGKVTSVKVWEYSYQIKRQKNMIPVIH